MAKKLANHRQPWSKSDDAQLRKEAKLKTPVKALSRAMGRTEAAIRAHAFHAGISLASKTLPTRRSPKKSRRPSQRSPK